jgi:hypothetical protein
MARKRTSEPPAAPARFKRGDRVQFVFGSSDVIGVVVEDRGPIGIGGRRLYGIEFPIASDENRYIELPEVEFTPAASS